MNIKGIVGHETCVMTMRCELQVVTNKPSEENSAQRLTPKFFSLWAGEGTLFSNFISKAAIFAIIKVIMRRMILTDE